MSLKGDLNRFVDRFKSLPRDQLKDVGASTIQIGDFKNCLVQYKDRLSLLRKCLFAAKNDGYALEFGVHKGRSISWLARLSPERQWFGFDSFIGLPEDWALSENKIYPSGHFALDALPKVPANVTLIKGMFEDSLPGWLSSNPGGVSFLHIDSDLYSSAKFILDNLNDRIAPGAVIVFDELGDWMDSGVYPNWREGEWRALCEWLDEKDRRIGVLGRGPKFSAGIMVLR
jgi:hypothetical protein